jgi:hypothetical protein
MNPKAGENLQIILQKTLKDSEKIDRLSLSSAHESIAPKERLRQLVERAKNHAEPVGTGIATKTETSGITHKGQPKASNCYAPPLKIDETELGDITLSYFIYCPEDERYGKSINATWHLVNPQEKIILLTEYVSDKSLVPGIAAYKENAGFLLDLLEESLEQYEKAAASS